MQDLLQQMTAHSVNWLSSLEGGGVEIEASRPRGWLFAGEQPAAMVFELALAVLDE